MTGRLRKLNYIRRHWEGDLPLVTAFWVNVFLVNVALGIFEMWMEQSSPIAHPVIASQVAVGFFLFAAIMVYPWQVVGVWRSADRYSKEPNGGIWGGAVRVVVVLGLLGTVSNLFISLPVYSDLFEIGFGRDEYADYKLSVTDDGTLVHLQGGLGFGVSDDVSQVLDSNDNVTGIILDSRGGRIYEGRQLANIISANSLDTYSLSGCYSACGTAYMAGARRYLGIGANLAFHQYRSPGENIAMYYDVGSEQDKDLELYRRQGVSEEFVERIFKAAEDDLWYPTVDELISANVVHEMVSGSSVKTTDWGAFDTSEVEKEIAGIAAFAAIKKYDPTTYSQIISGIAEQARRGAGQIEIQQTVGTYIETVAASSLPLTSDEALMIFATETVRVLERLNEIDPILCMKYLYPNQYGSFEMMKYLSTEEVMPLLDSFGEVIIGRYESKLPETNVQKAEELFTGIAEQLGEDAFYLDAPSLSNREEYAEACRTVIRFYELILAEDREVAANGLRYAFSP